jgi:hypothetical protein
MPAPVKPRAVVPRSSRAQRIAVQPVPCWRWWSAPAGPRQRLHPQRARLRGVWAGGKRAGPALHQCSGGGDHGRRQPGGLGRYHRSRPHPRGDRRGRDPGRVGARATPLGWRSGARRLVTDASGATATAAARVTIVKPRATAARPHGRCGHPWPTEQAVQRPRRCRDGRVLGNVERTEGSDAVKVMAPPTALPGDALGMGKGGRDDAARRDDEEENDVA